jgi:hypothetical protein
MTGKYRERLTFSNIVSMISLLFALGLGSAWAATELEKNEVKSKHIGKGQVKNSDLGENSVTSPKVADGSLLDDDFASGQLPQGPQGETGPAGSPDSPQQVRDKLVQVDGSGSNLDADRLDNLESSAFQQTGAAGRSTGGGGTVLNDGNTQFPVAGAPFIYSCLDSNARVQWNGPASEIWVDDGAEDPAHLATPGPSALLVEVISTNDRYTFVFSTATQVAEVELYSHHTASQCHYAYTLSEYQK